MRTFENQTAPLRYSEKLLTLSLISDIYHPSQGWFWASRFSQIPRPETEKQKLRTPAEEFIGNSRIIFDDAANILGKRAIKYFRTAETYGDVAMNHPVAAITYLEPWIVYPAQRITYPHAPIRYSRAQISYRRVAMVYPLREKRRNSYVSQQP